MPKNTKGGKNAKRGKNENEQAKREIILKSVGEAYASVIGPLGQYQMSLRLEDMTMSKGIIRGALRKKTWIVAGDLVRVQLREGFDDGTVDIAGKYTADEARELVKMGEVSPALIAGPQATSESSRSGATAIRFVSNTTTTGTSQQQQQQQKALQEAQSGGRQVEGFSYAAIAKFSNKGGAGLIEEEEEEDEAPPKKKWTKKSQEEDEEEDEEGDEEEGEEEEEEDEEETEEGQNAASNYDEEHGNATQDYQYHHKKEEYHKQRNKRFEQQKQKGGVGVPAVKAEDVEDI